MTSGVLSLLLLLIVMLSLSLWFYRTAKKVKVKGGDGTCEYDYDYTPLKLNLVATVLLCVGPVRNELFYVAMGRYAASGKVDSTTSGILDFCMNTFLRSKFLQIYTLLAYVFMFLATVRYMNLDSKIGTLI